MEYLLAIGFKSKKSIAEKGKTIRGRLPRLLESALVCACWKANETN